MRFPRDASLILLNTSIGSFLAPFTSSSISFAVPQIGNAFKVSFYLVIWIPLGFLIALSTLYLISGRLADEFGRVKLYRMGLVLYLIGMIVSLLSPTISLLIAFLFVGGAGAALVGSNSTAIVSLVYGSNRRGRALGINAMSVYWGLTLAPVGSGFVIHSVGWRYLFLLTIPVALLALILTFVSMKNIEESKEKLRIDKRGAIFFTSGLFLLVLYLSVGEVYGWIKEIYFLFIALILVATFFYVEREAKNPLVDSKLFMENRTFMASNVTAFLNYLSTFSIVFVFSLYLQMVLKYNSLTSGLVLISEPVMMVLLSPISGLLADKFGSRVVAALGMLVIGSSFLYLFFSPLKELSEIVIPLGLIGLGFGLFSAANTNSVMGSVNSSQYGMASGTLGTMRFTGQLMSIALASLLLAYSLPKTVILGMFSGITFTSLPEYSTLFVHDFRIVMLVSGVISFIGVYTSLMKNRGT